ncbi:MAG: sodium:proton antiporter [Firmicutes bacterium]|nr:sodium:proton antiporter [Bacillota bacterium]
MRNIIVRVIARVIIPFIQLYGFYVVFHGHLSPGGGFAGGTIIAASLILYVLAFGLVAEEKRVPERIAQIIESLGAIVYVVIGLVGVLVGAQFLGNKIAGFPLGVPGRILSSGSILILTIAIGFKVASTMITLFNHLIEDEKEG